jgi:acetyl esterase
MGYVDPQAQTLLDTWAALPTIPVAQLTPLSVRESDRAVEALQAPPEPVQRIEEQLAHTSVGQIPIRVYTPLEGTPPFPIFIYFHGGGFVIGSESYQSPLCALTNRTRHLLCAVEYRLAPEHPFPAAVDDAFAAAQWLIQNAARFGGDQQHIVIGGDSSGGNLAAVVTLLNRDQHAFNLGFQVLIYPMLDATCSQPSTQMFATGYGFSREKIEWYFRHYLPAGVDRRDPRISPLFAAPSQDLPAAFIATAEFDPLRDEAEVYAQRLRSAGAPVTLKRYAGMIHGFFQMAGMLDQGKTLIADIGAALQKVSER